MHSRNINCIACAAVLLVVCMDAAWYMAGFRASIRLPTQQERLRQHAIATLHHRIRQCGMVCCQGGVIAGRVLVDKIRWGWMCLMDEASQFRHKRYMGSRSVV